MLHCSTIKTIKIIKAARTCLGLHKTSSSSYTCRYSCIQCYGGIFHHNTEYIYNNKYTGTSIVILVKRWLWLPDDVLCKPKHAGAAFMISIVLIV
jgi:hypothetical protein